MHFSVARDLFMMLIVVVHFLELQELGYNGFAWAYYEDLVLFTSTSKALCFSTPEMTEFLHGTVTACKRIYVYAMFSLYVIMVFECIQTIVLSLQDHCVQYVRHLYLVSQIYVL